MNRVDRVLIIRHLAIVAGAATAYVLRPELYIGYTALWIVGVGAWLNVGAYIFRTRPSLTRLCLVASPVIGLGSWGALGAATGGVSSPFVAGLWLEVVLSAMALAPLGIVLVTAGAVAALWLQQSWLGFGGATVPLMLNSAFLVGMGGATFLVNDRWRLATRQLSERHADLGSRLELLERELQDERALSSLGEHAARLAHGHKNAVHSLRGFLSLIEPKLGDRAGSDAVLEGLRMAIDDLEKLAHLTLRTPPRAASEISCHPLGALERVIEEISAAHPASRWAMSSDGADPTLPISASELTEVIRVLVTNSVEAMRGGGEGNVATRCNGGEFSVVVRDQGEGLSAGACSRIFERGYTTKPNGSGYGLYLARKIVEERGGRLTARPGEGRGAVFEVSLPLRRGAAGSASAAGAR